MGPRHGAGDHPVPAPPAHAAPCSEGTHLLPTEHRVFPRPLPFPGAGNECLNPRGPAPAAEQKPAGDTGKAPTTDDDATPSLIPPASPRSASSNTIPPVTLAPAAGCCSGSTNSQGRTGTLSCARRPAAERLRRAARDAEHCSTALQAGVINKQAHGKHIDFPELIAQQPVLSYQATLICNLLREGRAGLRAAEIFTVGWTGRWKACGGLGRGRAGGQVRPLLPLAVLSVFQLLKK